MPKGLAQKVLRQMNVLGVKAITFSGGGEPTTNKHFGDIVSYAAERFKVGLYTNGLNISQVRSIANCFEWVYVSLDAADRDDFEVEKGIRVFQDVKINIQSLSKKVKVLGVGFLLHFGNYRKIRQMFQLGLRLGADYVQFHPGVGLHEYKWIPIALEVLDMLPQEKLYFPRQRFLNLSERYLTDYHDRGYVVCGGSELVPCIGADGELWVCPNTRGLRLLGNLREESFGDIWARRPTQLVKEDCRIACRNHSLNQTLAYLCEEHPHKEFV